MTSYRRAGFDLTEVPEPLRTVAALQLSIDITGDGGFELLFCRDYAGSPPFSLFADAWRRIGAAQCADCLDRAIALFPDPDPHRASREVRGAWVADRLDELVELGEAFRGAAIRSVGKLQQFVDANRAGLGLD